MLIYAAVVAAALAAPPANLDVTVRDAGAVLSETYSDKTDAVYTPGTVAWTRGTDEQGTATLLGHADFPGRDITVELLLRRNADRSIPASHYFEISIKTGGMDAQAITSLTMVGAKSDKWAHAKRLIGASVRVQGSEFLFALSAAPEDEANNETILGGSSWIDLPIVDGTGTKSVVSLGLDASAREMLRDDLRAWNLADAK